MDNIELTSMFDIDDCDVLMARSEVEQKFAEKMSSVVAVAGTYIREKNTIVIAALCKEPNNIVREKLDDYPEEPINLHELENLKELTNLEDLQYLKVLDDPNEWKEVKISELGDAANKEKKNE